jgi:hypothetical protein
MLEKLAPAASHRRLWMPLLVIALIGALGVVLMIMMRG